MTVHIYVVRDQRGVPLYVGRTTDVRRRLKEHQYGPLRRSFARTVVSYTLNPDAQYCLAEYLAITHFRPTANRLLGKSKWGEAPDLPTWHEYVRSDVDAIEFWPILTRP